MNKKKLIYVLFLILIGIWGIILYRVKSFSLENNVKIIDLKNKYILIQDIENKNDTFKLMELERDPFLNLKYKSNVTDLSQNKEIKKTIEEKNVNFKHQTIQMKHNILYRGLIINQKTGKKTAVIENDENKYILPEGDSMPGYRINAIQKDSVCLKNKTNYFWLTLMKIK